MKTSKIYIFVLLVISLNCFAGSIHFAAPPNYPNFEDNPLLTDRMRIRIAPYLLPLDHPMKPKLDSIFSQSRVLENERTLLDAGFVIIDGPMPNSFMIVARHPEIPGYVFKLYLDSETRCRKDIPHWTWLVRRCAGASAIRKLIRQEKIQYFSVPDKWIYILSVYPFSNVVNPQPVILMETDMELESPEESKRMWKTAVTRKHLDELYAILKHGYGGHGVVNLSSNVPYTKSGKFAFTDTEDPPAKLKLKRVKRYLSKGNRHYWDSLINNPKDN
ncbi:MAG: hypothetical protein JSS60_09045 [Verrucomicrobia bacterium]|nr:hypothetical protein [Verrucomicrobiota bacterium]